MYTFVAVLSACSHAGLLDEGRQLFQAMAKDYGVAPSVVHYTCMVDLVEMKDASSLGIGSTRMWICGRFIE